MNEADMVNEPINLKIAGVELKLKRLSTIKRRAIIEAVITEQFVAGILMKAKAAYADDEKRRYEYIDKAMLAIPGGKEMADLVSSHIPGQAYARIVAEAAGIGEDQAAKVLDDATADEVRVLLQTVAGKKKSPA